MSYSFFGGLHFHNPKDAAYTQPIEALPPPALAVIPMSMHTGSPCRPCVAVGDYVTAGQKVGTAVSRLSAPVHTPVAGRVAAVEPRVHPGGTSVLSVVVENDRSSALCPAVRPPTNPDSLTPDRIVTLIREAGIVDLSGDAFPTHVKIAAARGRADTVIVSGCESEPYIAGGRRLLLERTAEVLGGVRILARIFGVDRVHIAVEGGQDAAGVLRGKIEEEKAPAVVDAVPLRYPQGAEKQLCRSVAGRRLPPGAAPVDVGCAVFHAATAAAIYDAVYLGRPLTHRVVTVSGSGIREPRNLLCPIGTPIRFLLDACGGVDPDTFKIIAGGPMTGLAQYDMDAPVCKGTAAVLAFCKDEERSSPHPVCIRCGRCAAACPMGLQPVFMYQYEQADRLEALEKARVLDCLECGACTYVCPGRLPLVQSFRAGKRKISGAKPQDGEAGA